MWFVYQLFNTVNGKIYIGKSSISRSRKVEHFYVAKGGRKKYERVYSLIHKAINKYGTLIEFKIIQYFSCEADSLFAEKYWIEFFQSNVNKFGNEFGYNLTEGGEGVSGYKHTEAAKLKIKEKAPRGDKHRLFKNNEWGSHDWVGEKNPMFGKKHSPETIKKMIAAKTGAKNHAYGKKQSKEHVEKRLASIKKFHQNKKKNEESN